MFYDVAERRVEGDGVQSCLEAPETALGCRDSRNMQAEQHAVVTSSSWAAVRTIFVGLVGLLPLDL